MALNRYILMTVPLEGAADFLLWMKKRAAKLTDLNLKWLLCQALQSRQIVGRMEPALLTSILRLMGQLQLRRLTAYFFRLVMLITNASAWSMNRFFFITNCLTVKFLLRP
jgi:hypothetical protein